MKTIYELELHEDVAVSTFYSVTRVPGGWIYEDLQSLATVFVPFSNEFKPKKAAPKLVVDIEIRKENFKASLRTHITTYGKTMMIEFFEYWTEKKPQGKKMRFEMERVFDVKRRLQSWKKRSSDFKNGDKGKL